MEKVKEFYIKYKAWIWPIGSGVASVIILALVIVPQLLNYFTTNGQITKTKTQVEVLEAKAAGLEKIDRTKMKKDLDTVFRVLPTDQGVPEAITTLQQIVSQSGLSLKNISYGSSREGNSFSLSMTVVGQVSSIRSLLLKLRESPRVFRVEGISAVFQKSLSAAEVDIPLTVFYEPAPQTTSSLDQAVPVLSGSEEELLKTLEKNVSSYFVMPEESTASSLPLGKVDPFN